jgi:hypothetical protein
MAKSGPKPWAPTETELKMIARMAKAGMTIKMVCIALGRSVSTFHRCEKAHEMYGMKIAEAITMVGESAMQRIHSGEADTALHCFILKTRGGWKENETYLNLDDFCGEDGEEITLEAKLKIIDRQFAGGSLSVQNYKLLSDAISNRIKIDLVVQDIDSRLKELEGK